MNRIQLSKNFYLDEFLRSQTAARAGIAITVDDAEIFDNIQRLCTVILQPIRDALGTVHITSGYRPPEVNRLIGGSSRSMHRFGLAADIVVGGSSPYEVCQWLEESGIAFDQCIHEFGQWTHVGLTHQNASPRSQMLTATKQAVQQGRSTSKTVYTLGLHKVEVRHYG